MASIEATGSKKHHKFSLTVTEDSVNESTNSSKGSWLFVLSPVVKGFGWKDNSKIKYTITVNGKTYSGGITDYDGETTVTIAGGDETWERDAAGTKTISFGFEVTDTSSYDFTPGDASASGTMTLTAINTGRVYIANASGVPKKHLVYIHNGTTYENYIPYIHNGSEWQRY